MAKNPTTEKPQPQTGLAGTVAVSAPEKRTIRDYFRGDLGAIPVVITLILISLYFEVTTDGFFLQADNLTNLTLQIVTPGILAIAAVLVLLIGEIDLSLAAVAGASSAVTATLSVYQNWNPWLAILAGLLTGTVIGLVNGFFIAVLRVPSFIVTLAGSIGYAGFLLLIMGRQSTLIIRDDTIRALAPSYLPAVLGIGIPMVGVLLYIGAILWNQRSRSNAGLKVKTPAQLALQLGGALIVVAIVVIAFQSNLGVPQSTMIWIGLVVAFWLLLTRTPYGRHLYAVGGNAEAARRSGINVVGIKISIFALASTLAAFGGIMLASRSTAVATQIDSTLLLRSIAAAVIGGVSLFGGRGSVWAVVLGSLVIGGLENGLNLLNQEQSVKNVVQGIVLLLAVTADALVRRANAKGGR
jgi:D-xylose transport system permease protein